MLASYECENILPLLYSGIIFSLNVCFKSLVQPIGLQFSLLEVYNYSFNLFNKYRAVKVIYFYLSDLRQFVSFQVLKLDGIKLLKIFTQQTCNSCKIYYYFNLKYFLYVFVTSFLNHRLLRCFLSKYLGFPIFLFLMSTLLVLQ